MTRTGKDSRRIELPPMLHAALCDLADAEERSLSTLILLLINEALDRRLARQP
jgi:hypothetical protein